MTDKERIRLLTNCLRWLAKYNLGDEYEERIKKTLIKTGKMPKSWHYYKVSKVKS